MVFGIRGNRTIGGIALIGEWFSAKSRNGTFWISKSRFFHISQSFYKKTICCTFRTMDYFFKIKSFSLHRKPKFENQNSFLLNDYPKIIKLQLIFDDLAELLEKYFKKPQYSRKLHYSMRISNCSIAGTALTPFIYAFSISISSSSSIL